MDLEVLKDWIVMDSDGPVRNNPIAPDLLLIIAYVSIPGFKHIFFPADRPAADSLLQLIFIKHDSLHQRISVSVFHG